MQIGIAEDGRVEIGNVLQEDDLAVLDSDGSVYSISHIQKSTSTILNVIVTFCF